MSYNGTPLPDKNYGDPTTNQVGPSFEFTEGVKRECLLMGSSDHYLQYKRAQNFPKRRGTVNLWVKHSWIYNDINFHIFFNTTDMMLYKHQNDDRLSFLLVDGNQQLQYLNVALSDNIDDTDADQWYMITVMWNETKTKIFINGKFIKERIISSTTDNQGDNFTIGRQWGTLAVDDTCLDEFTVFNANLTEQEISDLYRKNGKSSLLFYASFDDESPDADFSVGDAKGTPPRD